MTYTLLASYEPNQDKHTYFNSEVSFFSDEGKAIVLLLSVYLDYFHTVKF